MGKSHQAGWVVLRGKRWYGYFRRRVLDPTTEEEQAKPVCILLKLKSEMTKSEAREALRMEVTKQNGQNLGSKVLKDGSRPSSGLFATATFRFGREIGGRRRRKRRWPR